MISRCTMLPNRCGRSSRLSVRRAFTLIELVIVIGLILLLVAITVTVSVGVMRQAEVRETRNIITILDNALQEWLLEEGREISYGRGANHPTVQFGEPCGNEMTPQIYRLPQLSSAGSHTGWTPEQALEIAQQETDFLIATLLRRPVFEDMITSIDSRFMRRVQVVDPPEDQDEDIDHLLPAAGYLDFTPEYIYRFVDAWDRPILAIHPGREFVRRCQDGTLNPDSGYCVGAGQTERCADDDGTVRTPLENAFGVGEARRIYFVSAGPSERFGLLHLHQPDAALDDPQRRQVDRAGDNIYSYPVLIDAARPQ